MDILSVTRDVEGTGGLVQLPISDIAYMEYIKRMNRVVVHTPDKQYYLMGTLQYWQGALAASGHKFAWVDRTNVVNLDRIRIMDSVRHIAYFDYVVDPKSKRCTLTNLRFDELSMRLGELSAAITTLV